MPEKTSTREQQSSRALPSATLLGVTPTEGRARVVVEGIEPQVDGGRFAIKRVVGDHVAVECDAFVDGHDAVACVLRYRFEGDEAWREVAMQPLGNDRWRGEFAVTKVGRYVYTVQGWVDRFGAWARDLRKRVDAGQDVAVDLEIGAQLVDEAADRAPELPKVRLHTAAAEMRAGGPGAVETALEPELRSSMAEHAERRFATTYPIEFPLVVDRERARFSAWYELFPRSTAPEPGRHGTLRDAADRLRYVAGMGFDVLYLPPIHPVGREHRKGRNNAVAAAPNDLGSPWAIGSAEGGHKSIHPQLGTLEDLRFLVGRCREHGVELAMDLAFQCAPDHPYVHEHPEWFRHRPDGPIQYAENPPKKYQDVYPFDFETPNWRELWDELTSVALFWCEQGVRIFRVDNPHTKPFPFWEHLISSVKARYPETIFLAEAFTRPKVMHRLAKLGFTQSYTYFAWRQTPAELEQYMRDLTETQANEFFRPNFWPNTPDILTEQLQLGGKAMFHARVVLAATLSASYGIYGPAYELCEARPREPGGEEYLDSEKYEIRHWDWDSRDSLRDVIARLNRVRREHPALQRNDNLRFHPVDNERILAYSKSWGDDEVLCLVNCDPHHTQSGWITYGDDQPLRVHNLLTDARYLWQGPRNYVELSPQSPARVFRVTRRTRTERDFDYY